MSAKRGMEAYVTEEHTNLRVTQDSGWRVIVLEWGQGSHGHSSSLPFSNEVMGKLEKKS